MKGHKDFLGHWFPLIRSDKGFLCMWQWLMIRNSQVVAACLQHLECPCLRFDFYCAFLRDSLSVAIWKGWRFPQNCGQLIVSVKINVFPNFKKGKIKNSFKNTDIWSVYNPYLQITLDMIRKLCTSVSISDLNILELLWETFITYLLIYVMLG